MRPGLVQFFVELRRTGQDQRHKKGQQNANPNASTRLHLPPRFRRGELARKKFLPVAWTRSITLSRKLNHFVEGPRTCMSVPRSLFIPLLYLPIFCGIAGRAVDNSSEIVRHGSVKSPALPKLRRATANAAAVAQLVDRVENVDDIETNFNGGLLRDFDPAR